MIETLHCVRVKFSLYTYTYTYPQYKGGRAIALIYYELILTSTN